MVLDLLLSALLFWAAGMSKAGSRSLFLRVRLVLVAEPELRLGGYLLTKGTELNHPVVACPAIVSNSKHNINIKLSGKKEGRNMENCRPQWVCSTVHTFWSLEKMSCWQHWPQTLQLIKVLINQSVSDDALLPWTTTNPPTRGYITTLTIKTQTVDFAFL